MPDKTKHGGFILIAEDDRGANSLEAARLAPLGLEIRSVYSAKEVLALLKESRPKLMLLDYSLPDMSAVELLAQLEKNNIGVPPYITITGLGEEKLAVELMKAGAEDYLVKDSVLLDHLADRVKQALASVDLRGDLDQLKSRMEQERDKYKQLFNNSNEAIFVHTIGPDGAMSDFSEVNDAACASLGYTREELLKLGPLDIDAGALGDKRAEIRNSLLRDGRLKVFSVLKAKDGRRIPVEMSIRAFDFMGEKMVMALSLDISEKERADAALRESEERYRALFDLAGDGILLMNTEGGGLVVNRAFAKMHGYGSPAEMAHLDISKLDTLKTRAQRPESMRTIMAGETLTFEVEHFHKDGHVFALSVTANRVLVGGKTFILAVHRALGSR